MQKFFIYDFAIDDKTIEKIISFIKPNKVFESVSEIENLSNIDDNDLFVICSNCNHLVSKINFDKILSLAKAQDSVICAEFVVDTAKQIDSEGVIIKTLDRKRLRKISYPLIIKGAIVKRLLDNHDFTLDLEKIIEFLIKRNFKIKIWQV